MKNISRRNFLRAYGAIATGVVVFPGFISCPPNGKVNMAFVGVGGRGKNRLGIW